MEEKRLVPRRRFEGFEDKKMLSYKWEDFVDISDNMVDPRKEEFYNFPHIGPGNIQSFTGIILDNVKTVKEDLLISGKFHFNYGDIIYGKINPQLGKYALTDFEGLASADTYILKAKKGLNQRYLFMLLQTSKFFLYSVSMSKRSGIPKINRDELNGYSFLAPCEIEQQKVGNFFHILDKRIANQERKIAKLKALKEAYLTEMFPQEGETVPKRRFAGFEGEWSIHTLEELAPIRGGYAFQSSKFQKQGIPIIRISNILSNETVGGDFTFYQELDADENFIVNKGSILIAMSGATTGKVAILNRSNPKEYQNQRVGYFRRVKGVNYEFISILVRTVLFINQLSTVLIAGAQPNISPKEIGLFKFRIPSYKEQQKIGNFFKNLDDQLATEEAKLEKLKQTKAAYLEEMFV